MKKQSFNDMLGGGFDSIPQEKLMWLLHERGCIGKSKDESSTWNYEWVPEVYKRFGHATHPGKGFTEWRCPCASLVRRLVTYGEMLEASGFIKEADIIDRTLFRLVKAQSTIRVVTADYLNSIKDRLGLRRPFTTVDEALQNFSQRLGLDTVTKRALSTRLHKLAIDDFERDQQQDLKDASENPALAGLGLGLDPDQFSDKREYERAKKKLRQHMKQQQDPRSSSAAGGEDEPSFALKDDAPFNTTM
jgi:hypothetical protein